MSCSRTQQWRWWGSNPRPLGLESSTLPVSSRKDVTIVDVKSTESDTHFIGYFKGFSIEMLWYLIVLTYWVGLDIIAIYVILWKIDKSKSNTIKATMWENDSLRKKNHNHRNRIVWFYRVMLTIFKFLFDWIIQILKWDMANLLKAYVPIQCYCHKKCCQSCVR